MGIEPTYSAWKAEVLPLNYTRAAKRRVAYHNRYKTNTVEGITPNLQSSTLLRHCAKHCDNSKAAFSAPNEPAQFAPSFYLAAWRICRDAALRVQHSQRYLVEGGGFEPPKAEPSDLQSDPFGHSGTPPSESRAF